MESVFTADETRRVIALERAVDLTLNGAINPDAIGEYAQRAYDFLTGATDSANVGAPAVGAQVHVD